MDYKMHVTQYGRSLPDQEKNTARNLIKELLNKGKTFEWIYWAIWNLGNRSIKGNTALFFYKPFCDEVEDQIRIARDFTEATDKEKSQSLVLTIKYDQNIIIDIEDEERMKSFNKCICELKDIDKWDQEQINNLNYLYDKYYVTPCLLLPKAILYS